MKKSIFSENTYQTNYWVSGKN